MSESRNGIVTAGFVLGIIAIVCSFIPFVNNLAFIMGVLAIIFGLIGIIKKASKGKAIAALVLGILSCAITLIMQEAFSNAIDEAVDDATASMDAIISDMDGSNTEELLGTAVNVELGTFESATDEYGIVSTRLPVTVTNLTDESKSFDIHLESVDTSGNRIAEDYVYENSLGAGQSVSEDAFEYLDADTAAAVADGTFQIVEVSMY